MIGERIAQYRKEKGLTQKELGEMVGLSSSAISLIESGKNNPTWENLKKISGALSISESELMGSSDNDPISKLINELIEATEARRVKWVLSDNKEVVYRGKDTGEIVKIGIDSLDTIGTKRFFISDFPTFEKSYRLVFTMLNLVGTVADIYLSYGGSAVTKPPEYSQELKALYQAIRISAEDKNYIYDHLKVLEDLKALEDLKGKEE